MELRSHGACVKLVGRKKVVYPAEWTKPQSSFVDVVLIVGEGSYTRGDLASPRRESELMEFRFLRPLVGELIPGRAYKE